MSGGVDVFEFILLKTTELYFIYPLTTRVKSFCQILGNLKIENKRFGIGRCIGICRASEEVLAREQCGGVGFSQLFGLLC